MSGFLKVFHERQRHLAQLDPLACQRAELKDSQTHP